MMAKLNTKDLKYGNIEMGTAANITEVAIRHGLNPEVEEQFYWYIEEVIAQMLVYRLWEEGMGDDL